MIREYLDNHFLKLLLTSISILCLTEAMCQFYGERLEKIHIEKLLLLPLNGSYIHAENNQLPVIDKINSSRISQIINRTLDSIINQSIEAQRFPSHPVVDSMVFVETVKCNQIIFKNNTERGVKVTPVISKLMQKTKADYSLSVVYEYWDRSKENIQSIRMKNTKAAVVTSVGYTIFGRLTHVKPGNAFNTTSFDTRKSFILLLSLIGSKTE